MKRLLLVTGAAVGACAIAVPAAAGLSSNPSFSEHVPVRVPSKAQVVTFDDHGGATTTTPRTPSPTSTSTTTAEPRRTEPGDDRGSHGSTGTRTHVEPGDDHGTHTGTHVEPGDDHGTHTGTHVEPGDDHQRGKTKTATTAAASSSSHGGSDDTTTGHGGKHGQDD